MEASCLIQNPRGSRSSTNEKQMSCSKLQGNEWSWCPGGEGWARKGVCTFSSSYERVYGVYRGPCVWEVRAFLPMTLLCVVGGNSSSEAFTCLSSCSQHSLSTVRQVTPSSSPPSSSSLGSPNTWASFASPPVQCPARVLHSIPAVGLHHFRIKRDL